MTGATHTRVLVYSDVTADRSSRTHIQVYYPELSAVLLLKRQHLQSLLGICQVYHGLDPVITSKTSNLCCPSDGIIPALTDVSLLMES